MVKQNVTKQAGFSLIELMVVVAIIGILATIAVPNFQRFQNKAKQSEAKSALSAIYAAEQAFRAEWSAYRGDFRDIGYAPEGNFSYNVGFAAAGAVPPAPFNASVQGGAAAGTCFHNRGGATCGILGTPTAAATAAANPPTAPVTTAACGMTITSAAPTPTAFGAGAVSRLAGAADDRWGINELKQMCNIAQNI